MKITTPYRSIEVQLTIIVSTWPSGSSGKGASIGLKDFVFVDLTKKIKTRFRRKQLRKQFAETRSLSTKEAHKTSKLMYGQKVKMFARLPLGAGEVFF